MLTIKITNDEGEVVLERKFNPHAEDIDEAMCVLLDDVQGALAEACDEAG